MTPEERGSQIEERVVTGVRRIGEWIVLLPLWRKLIPDSRGGQIGMAITTPFLYLVVAAIIVSAVGGSSSTPLLHLRNYDTSPENYRAAVQKTFLDDPAGLFCRGLPQVQGSLEQLSQAITGSPNWTVLGSQRPGQTPNPDDLLRTAAIVREECDRLLTTQTPSTSATPQPLLHLRGYDIYPDVYRVFFRGLADLAVTRNEPSFCNTINWATVTPQAVINAFKGDLGQIAALLGDAVPAQTANPRDDVAAALIILDECHRVAP